jgi:hypothetical protein
MVLWDLICLYSLFFPLFVIFICSSTCCISHLYGREVIFCSVTLKHLYRTCLNTGHASIQDMPQYMHHLHNKNPNQLQPWFHELLMGGILRLYFCMLPELLVLLTFLHRIFLIPRQNDNVHRQNACVCHLY